MKERRGARRRATCRSLAALLVAVTAATVARAALFERGARDLAAELAAARGEGKVLVVAFEMQGCEACELMRRAVFADASTEAEIAKGFRTVTVDLDSQAPIVSPDGRSSDAPRLARSLGLSGAPGFAFFEADGGLCFRYSGGLSRRDFRRLGAYVLRGDYEMAPFRPLESAEGVDVGR